MGQSLKAVTKLNTKPQSVLHGDIVNQWKKQQSQSQVMTKKWIKHKVSGWPHQIGAVHNKCTAANFCYYCEVDADKNQTKQNCELITKIWLHLWPVPKISSFVIRDMQLCEVVNLRLHQDYFQKTLFVNSISPRVQNININVVSLGRSGWGVWTTEIFCWTLLISLSGKSGMKGLR